MQKRTAAVCSFALLTILTGALFALAGPASAH